MSRPIVKFNTLNRPEFFRELRNRVNNYFTENNIPKTANIAMKFKTVFMLCLYFIPLGLLISGTVTSLWMVMFMWFIMGFGMSGIGLSIMHDAIHGSYSNNKYVNKILGFSLNLLGGYNVNWKIQHNVLHHSFTNIENHDEDIAIPVMRFTPNQKLKKIYKYQAYYAVFFYGIMSIYWFLAKDFIKLRGYHKQDLLAPQGLTYRKALIQVTFYKLFYAFLTLGLPIYFAEIHWWQMILGFLIMEFISGIILAFIFQPAHVIEETDFFVVDEEGCVENNWAIHQMKTTANFANESKLLSWFVGGLNYQIEHHLFANICHIHYKKLSKIVKQTAQEFNLPYHEHKTFWQALKSHFSLLNQLGTGAYDKKLALAKA